LKEELKTMAANPNAHILQTAKLIIPYEDQPNDFPKVGNILFNGQKLGDLLTAFMQSALVNTAKYMPFQERVWLDPAFETMMTEYFDELVAISQRHPDLSVVCADRFFEFSCTRYWDLIVNQGSKNLAVDLLEEICKCVDKWEKARKQRVHKGTPYYFLTYGYREMGDVDSAFAAAFKAIEEDRQTSRLIFADERYKQSPAFKYITLVDDRANFLHGTVIKLRSLLEEYVKEYKTLNPNFSINEIDTKLLNGKKDLQQIAFVFVYSLELIKKYRDQLYTLPSNDFYKIRNLSNLFNLCLVVDKVLEQKFKRKFKKYTGNDRMYISDGVVLLFEAKGWIPALTLQQRTNPRSLIGSTTPVLSDELALYAKELVFSPLPMTFGYGAGVPLTDDMRNLILAYKLRNEAAHSLKKETILVTKYEEIVKHLMFAIFAAI
jgi:hypothetical protein